MYEVLIPTVYTHGWRGKEQGVCCDKVPSTYQVYVSMVEQSVCCDKVPPPSDRCSDLSHDTLWRERAVQPDPKPIKHNMKRREYGREVDIYWDDKVHAHFPIPLFLHLELIS